MHLNPARVSSNGFVLSFKLLSAHCVCLMVKNNVKSQVIIFLNFNVGCITPYHSFQSMFLNVIFLSLQHSNQTLCMCKHYDEAWTMNLRTMPCFPWFLCRLMRALETEVFLGFCLSFLSSFFSIIGEKKKMICFVRGQTLPSFLKFLRRFKVQSQVVILSKSPPKYFLQVLQIFIGVKNLSEFFFLVQNFC